MAHEETTEHPVLYGVRDIQVIHVYVPIFIVFNIIFSGELSTSGRLAI